MIQLFCAVAAHVKRYAPAKPALLSACALGVIGILASARSMASDWPAPEDAWLPAPDGFRWPETELAVEFKEYLTAVLDFVVSGVLAPNLEFVDTPQRMLAAWVELGNNSPTLLYVDQALSGTGGKYIFILASAHGQWELMGEMLCNSVLLNERARHGWKSNTCEAQHGLQYQRQLHVMCPNHYVVARHEVHDLENGVVVLGRTECAEEAVNDHPNGAAE